jgi:phenazine biosynthesis protein phzE
MTPRDMFTQVLGGTSGPFALLHRPEATGAGWLEVLIGGTSHAPSLADIPLSDQITQIGKAQHDALVLVPHHQIVERGFVAADDGSPLIVLSVAEQGKIATTEALKQLPDDPITLTDTGFDIDDAAYGDIVHDVLANEIGTGAGSNFVIKRSFVADITDYSISTALSLFRRLLVKEAGAYWTFIVNTGDRTFVGATPERHISLKDKQAVMNPISGTYRYPATGPDVAEIMAFLDDRKETDELYMVLDEELKMMARVCDGGGQVVGPFLREMAQLAHTEYYIEGTSTLDPRTILKETLLAPTVTGSPLENACRVIARYEPKGRAYYGGVAALIGRGADGARVMDSAILIRTADICETDTGVGQLKVGVGATLVRHSDAASEIAETHTKAAGVLAALGMSEPAKAAQTTLRKPTQQAAADPRIQAALGRRNDTIANFWLKDAAARSAPHPVLQGHKALVIDAEDTFTAMLGHQLRAIGLDVDVLPFDAPYTLADYDLVVLGPGPGDPRDKHDPRMTQISSVIDQLLANATPFLSVCLSHQLLCRRLGLQLNRRKTPNQGAQNEIDLFGTPRRVGYYNSYAANSPANHISTPDGGRITVCRNQDTGEVHALNGPHFTSMQFHVESVLTQDGLAILTDLLTPLMATQKVLTS